MKLPEGFHANLVASEPMIAQPVCIEFDDRGRLWVIQYLQYPNPNGLQRAQVDRFSRTKYDKVPEPPPRGPKGADRITILSDFDEKGHARHAKDFVTGLNLASGMAFGHGGVYVLQVPYLLFYPDKNGDDVPDSNPEVLLTGFGMEDAHSVANSLTWGPDGWLYGCQGSTVTANIRGIEFQQGVWRYHPVTKRFELFCEGGGNSWGLDFDKDGNLIYSTNLSPFRNVHGVQGGYYWKSFGKHGALHNPYTYGYFDHVPYQNFTGGHVTDGGIIYQGNSFPEKYLGKYIANDLLGHAVQWHNLEKDGSSFKASYGGELLTPNDTWFAPCDLTMGADGALYVSDWSDKRTAHPDPDADWDRSNGRVYRIQWQQADIAVKEPALPAWQKLSSEKVVELVSSKNDWIVRKARRTLADRRDVTIYPKLRAQVFEMTDEHFALESFWALYVSGGADEAFLNDALDHPSAKIRRWAVRFLGDADTISPTSHEHLLRIAVTEPDVLVRSQLASTAQRLPAKVAMQLVAKIARDVDASDPHVPLLLWWAVEKQCVVAVSDVVTLFASPSAWQSKIIAETILPRLMRRYAAEGKQETLAACGTLLLSAPSEKIAGQLLESFEKGLSEQPKNKQITSVEKLPSTLRKQLTELWNDKTNNRTLIRLLSRLGYKPAWQRTLALAADASSPLDLRLAMLQFIAEMADPDAMGVLLGLSATSEPEAIQLAALEAIQQLPNAELRSILASYTAMSPRVRSKARDVLLSRKQWAYAFLGLVDSGQYDAREVALDQLQNVATFEDKQLNELVRKHWGNIGRGTPEEKLADIRRFNNDLRAASGDAKRGRDLFVKNCAVCHELFGEGEKVGPELTHGNRADKDFLLTSIVDPSAVIRKEFLNYNVEMKDGRSLSGLIAEQSANSVTLMAAKNERTTIPRDKIVSMQESSISLMPEGLMHPLSPQERRDLFTYLQSPQPVVKK
ncbi:MAG: putative rane-bound dehydrogenase [Verrucomicrobiales bacterium]|nr:putative rane-bound dehydrogenase [Verrucomicrobiales bacterium]